MTNPKILIVEDEEALQNIWRDEVESALKGDVTVLQAFTMEEGDLLLEAHASDIAVMAVDACVPGKMINTIPLVRKARRLLGKRPIIAVSGNEDFQKELVAAGCDPEHQCPQKWDLLCAEELHLHRIILRLLELSDVYL